MEELQKTTKKKSAAKKETTATTKEVKTRKSTKEPKETKSTSKSSTTKAKKTVNEATKTSKAKTAKTTTTKKEPNTTKQPKATKTTTTKKAKTPVASSLAKQTKLPKVIEKKEVSEEPKLTVVHDKKEEQTKKAEPIPKEKNTKEKKAKKQRKGYIEISVGAIVCAIIIFILIVFNVKLGVRAYNVLTNKESANLNSQPNNNISVTQEVGNVLNNENKIVNEMLEKIIFPTNVTASIYNKEPFNINTIPNDLKLMMGWAKTKDVDKLESINEKNQKVVAIEKDIMDKTVKSIFGPEVKYKAQSFDNTIVSKFSSHCENKGTIDYDSNLYTSVASENVENKMYPLIYQEIQKVVKYTEAVIVYVKVAYIDVEEQKYIVYKDFNEENFEERLLEVTSEELFKNEFFDLTTGEGTVTIDKNTALDSIRNELNTYKYIFSLNEETGEYYLSKFNKSLEIE